MTAAKKGLAELLLKHGIGGLLRPWQERRVGAALADAEARRMLVLAAAEARVSELRAEGTLSVFFDESKAVRFERVATDRPRVEPTFRSEDLAILATSALIEGRIRHEVNVAAAVAHAEEALLEQPDEQPTSKEPSSDWLHRWQVNAGQVSEKELQELWGRLLAGEVRAPGSYSLRTLESLRNLSSPEADLIARFARYVCHDVVLSDAGRTYFNERISASDMIFLELIGVIGGYGATGLGLELSPRPDGKIQHPLRWHNRVILLTRDQGKKISIPVIPLTPVGKEILSIGSYAADEDYLVAVAADFRRKFSLATSVGTRVPVNGGYHLRDLVELKG